MDNKIVVLRKLADLLNENNITWNVGASCMLFLRNVVDTFDDIDIMVHLDDVQLVKKLLSDYEMLEKNPNKKYKTKIFLECQIDGVEIDIMAGFTIIKDNTEYYFPISKGSKYDQLTLNGSTIHLESIETWLKYYTLIDRKDKIIIINQFLNGNK